MKKTESNLTFSQAASLLRIISAFKTKGVSASVLTKLIQCRRSIMEALTVHDEAVKAIVIDFKIKANAEGAFDFAGHPKIEEIQKKLKELGDAPATVASLNFLSMDDFTKVNPDLVLQDFDFCEKFLVKL